MAKKSYVDVEPELDLPLAFAPPFQLHPDLRTFNSSGKPLLKQFSIEVVFYIGSLTRPSSRGTLLFKVLCFPSPSSLVQATI